MIKKNDFGYSKMLIDMSVTEDHLKELTHRKGDRVNINLESVKIKKSKINGKGIFSKIEIKHGDVIGEANIDRKRTQIGRYTNHSDNPNAVAKVKVDKLIFVAVNDIPPGKEVTVDYRLVRKEALRLEKRLSILDLHDKIEADKHHLTADDFPLKHYFSEGVYVREFFMEKGAVVVGKIHRHNHIAMLIQGSAKVFSEVGDFEMKAPYIWNSKAGEKRAVLAHENCIFVTVHPTEETDLDKIEEQVIAPNYEALEGDL